MWPPLYYKEHILLYRGGHTEDKKFLAGPCASNIKKKFVFFCVLEIQSQFVLSVTQSVKLSMCEKWEDKIVEIGSKYTWRNKKKNQYMQNHLQQFVFKVIASADPVIMNCLVC